MTGSRDLKHLPVKNLLQEKGIDIDWCFSYRMDEHPATRLLDEKDSGFNMNVEIMKIKSKSKHRVNFNMSGKMSS